MLDLEHKLKIEDIYDLDNIASELDSDDLRAIGDHIIEGYDIDKESISDWIALAEKTKNLAKLELEGKNYPFEGASNVKFPLITQSVLQYQARLYPEFVSDGKPVKSKIVGPDADGKKKDRAERITRHMSYQLIVKNERWEEGVDKLIFNNALIGTVFTKTYYDPIRGDNSVEICNHDAVIVNDNIDHLEEARRISYVVVKHNNEIVANTRKGLYLDPSDDEQDLLEFLRAHCGDTPSYEDYHQVIEQHCYLDLDQDGYEEPYIVTVHKESRKVLRIVARYDLDSIIYNEDSDEDDQVIDIKADEYFTDYHFLQNPDGGFYSWGIGMYLYSVNHSVNTVLNQLLDAGKFANLPAGFVDESVRISKGQQPLRPGEFRPLRIVPGSGVGNAITPMPFKEPSIVLFQLLGVLVDSAKDLASITDVLSGHNPGQNTPASTTATMVEQGLKVFSSVKRRFYRSFKKDLRKLYNLNAKYLDDVEYFNLNDEESYILRDDYNDDDLDVFPIADPNVSSEAARIARAQMLIGALQMPGINPEPIVKEYLEALGAPDYIIKSALPPKDPNAAPPPEILELQSEIDERGKKLQLAHEELQIKKQQVAQKEREINTREAEAEAKIASLRAKAMKDIAEAEGMQMGVQLDTYKAELDHMAKDKKNATDIEKELIKEVKKKQSNN